MKVVWLSAGVSSFIAGYVVKETVDKWIYIDVKDQHPDSIRFIKDCEKVLGTKVEILRSDKYEDVADVIRKRKFINSLTAWRTMYWTIKKGGEKEMGVRAIRKWCK